MRRRKSGTAKAVRIESIIASFPVL